MFVGDQQLRSAMRKIGVVSVAWMTFSAAGFVGRRTSKMNDEVGASTAYLDDCCKRGEVDAMIWMQEGWYCQDWEGALIHKRCSEMI
jgi:hypothetical protein